MTTPNIQAQLPIIPLGRLIQYQAGAEFKQKAMTKLVSAS